MEAGRWLTRAPTRALARMLGVAYPIIQAPMVGISTPQLAAAVSNAGALGSIGLGASTLEAAKAQIRATGALTGNPFNANFFCHTPPKPDVASEMVWLAKMAPLFAEFGAEPPRTLKAAYDSFLSDPDAITAMLLEEKPAVVSFHFGLPPRGCIKALRDAGMVTMACVTAPHEAALASEAGIDAIIAQGYEAGGHRGVFNPEEDEQFGTLALVQLLVKDFGAGSAVPIIAAGGIMDGKGIGAALQLGAAGVQLGTAFIRCPESAADQAFHNALQSDRAYHTSVSASISGRPARGLVNRLFLDISATAMMPSYPLPYEATKALDRAARVMGCTDFAVQLAGQATPLARAMPAEELVRVLVEEVDQAK